MIIKCPQCGGALEYDINDSRLECKYCDSHFNIDEITDKSPLDEEMMESDIYCCTTCGAELLINNVEASTFCAYCGQPTIVLNRVSKKKKPKYIIPFSINKDEALTIIRKRLREGILVPNAIKNFKVEQLRGIYVPFALADVYYSDKQLVKGEVKSGKSRITRYFVREGHCKFKQITVDTSKKFEDDSSMRLEPYCLEKLEPFDIGYLSGYYADCGDEEEKAINEKSFLRAKELFDEHMIESVNASDKELRVSNPKHEITRVDRALLPAWFLVFNDGKQYHTLMVNGQTGKIVGAVPYSGRKAAALFTITAGVLCTVCASIVPLILASAGTPKHLMNSFIIIGGIMLTTLFYGLRTMDLFKKSRYLTSKKETKDLVSKRQDN